MRTTIHRWWTEHPYRSIAVVALGSAVIGVVLFWLVASRPPAPTDMLLVSAPGGFVVAKPQNLSSPTGEPWAVYTQNVRITNRSEQAVELDITLQIPLTDNKVLPVNTGNWDDMGWKRAFPPALNFFASPLRVDARSSVVGTLGTLILPSQDIAFKNRPFHEFLRPPTDADQPKVGVLFVDLLSEKQQRTEIDAKWMVVRSVTEVVEPAWERLPPLLAEMRSNTPNVEIAFMELREKEYSEHLLSAFAAAGWAVPKSPSGPMAQTMRRHFYGLELRGWNRQLVENVAKLLQRTGATVHTQIDEPIPTDHPKWSSWQGRVRIVVGDLTQLTSRR